MARRTFAGLIAASCLTTLGAAHAHAQISTTVSYNVINKASNKCIDARSSGTANGTAVQQYTCNGTGAQQWRFQTTNSGYYRVNSNSASTQAWDVSNVSAADNAAIHLWAYGGGNNQQWLPVAETGGTYHFVSRFSGKCLDVPAASAADSVQLVQYTCNGTGAQSFRLQQAGTVTPTPTAGPRATPTPTSPSRATPTTPPGSGFPSRFSAPYVAVWNNPNLATLASQTGHRFWTLAFIINGSGTCNPMWNGDTPLTTTYNVAGLRAAGGDVIASFGGAGGTEISRSCTDVASAQAAYQRVINAMGLKAIDLDIESGSESDTASVDRRNKAMRNLQVANPGLRVNYTLAVNRTGLPGAQINLLNNAKSNGVAIGSVNIMAMDYGPCYTDMGQAAVDAANATRNQLSSNAISAGVGITPMIGVNDVTCENYTTNDANVTVNFAQANSFVNLLAYWEQSADGSRSYINIFKTFH